MRIGRAAAGIATSAALLGAACGAQAQQAAGQWKPAGNVEFVVGAGAGGENDRIARAIQRALTKEQLVNSMTVLNKPGAGQIIAMNYLAGKSGEANEIGLASGSFINAIARNGSNLNKQMTPLMKLFDAYQCYFTSVDSAYRSMVDVRDRLKADPTSVTFAFPVGLGSPLHISVVNVGKAVGAPPNKLVTVVFDSGSDVSVQAAGNHIDVGETSIGSAMPLILGGKLRMLGIASPERLPGELAKISHAARTGPRCGDGKFLHRSRSQRTDAGTDRILDANARPSAGRSGFQARSRSQFLDAETDSISRSRQVDAEGLR